MSDYLYKEVMWLKSNEVKLINDIKKREKRIEDLEEVLKEVALEPYKDSDLKSLLNTLRNRAINVLRNSNAQKTNLFF